jgi:hypothetical protein
MFLCEWYKYVHKGSTHSLHKWGPVWSASSSVYIPFLLHQTQLEEMKLEKMPAIAKYLYLLMIRKYRLVDVMVWIWIIPSRLVCWMVRLQTGGSRNFRRYRQQATGGMPLKFMPGLWSLPYLLLSVHHGLKSIFLTCFGCHDVLPHYRLRINGVRDYKLKILKLWAKINPYFLKLFLSDIWSHWE